MIIEYLDVVSTTCTSSGIMKYSCLLLKQLNECEKDLLRAFSTPGAVLDFSETTYVFDITYRSKFKMTAPQVRLVMLYVWFRHFTNRLSIQLLIIIYTTPKLN